MTRVLTFMMAAAISLSLSLPLAAQEYNDPRGFRIKSKPTDPRDSAADAAPELTLMLTARCLADDRLEQSQEYLATLPASDAEEVAFAAFGNKIRKCMPSMDMSSVGNTTRARGKMTMSFDHSALRGALAESLMRETDMVLSPARMALGDDGMYIAGQFHGGQSPSPARAFALGFAGCVMGNNPSAIEALFKTDPGSAEEKAAIVAMAPSFGQCIMQGQELRLAAPTLRNQLAEVAYYAMMAEAPE
ncbi:hypothetical protein N9D37_01175 [Erythrobacter sp.]|nr:hypothetical protein [Erythrobacter sp.]